MAKKVVILIDGGHLRVKANIAGKTYNPDFIEKFSLNCGVPLEHPFPPIATSNHIHGVMTVTDSRFRTRDNC